MANDKTAGGKRKSRPGAEEAEEPARAASEPTGDAPARPPSAAQPSPASESDSEDDGVRNMIGDVPLEWYDDYDHLGYGLDGKRFARPPQRDELDALIERYDQGNSRTVYDALHGELVELTDDDVGMIRRIQNAQYPDASFNPYPRTVEWVSSVVEREPLWARPPSKASFLPSKWERKRVARLVRAMRSESYAKSLAAQAAAKEAQRPDYNYAIWDETLEDLTREQRRMHKRLTAPKLPPPTNAESYNPPAEYLLSAQEEAEWLAQDREDRGANFVPRKHDALRLVPAYASLAMERFQRCLDLYLCPRTQRTKLSIDPDSLLPQLPDLAQLEPYPKRLAGSFCADAGCVRTLCVHPAGQWLATGGDDGRVRVWEISSGRCVLDWTLAAEGAVVAGGVEPIHRLAFAPAAERALLAVAVGVRVLLLAVPHLQRAGAGSADGGAGAVCAADDEAVGAPLASAGASVFGWSHERLAAPVVRSGCAQPAAAAAPLLGVALPLGKAVRCLAWHPRCDYLATVVPDGGAKAVLLHQVSRRVTQQPFSRNKGRVESALFHPSRAQLFVATQRDVRVYDLVEQTLLKRLSTGVQWISSMAIHPSGDNLIVGSYDKRVVWFDLDLSTKPYKALRSHTHAVRAVAFHAHLPLFASASDDLGVQVFHGEVHDDLASNATILPLKRIEAHAPSGAGLGVMECVFHPQQPWLFSCGADGAVHLYT
jgi:ribosome biogenesis protein ERB1